MTTQEYWLVFEFTKVYTNIKSQHLNISPRQYSAPPNKHTPVNDSNDIPNLDF